MKFKETRTIWYAPSSTGTGSLHWQETYIDMSQHGWVRIKDHTVELDIDLESELAVVGLVQKLEAAKSDVRAEAGRRCTILDQQISNLLRLDYVPPADAAAPELKTVEADDDIPF